MGALNSILLHVLSGRMGTVATKTELNSKNFPALQLENQEITQINQVWGKISKSINYDYWRLYKHMGFFSPFLVPDDIFASKMLRILNPLMDANVFHKKSLYDITYRGLRQPRMIAKCIDGRLYVEGKMFRHRPVDFYKSLKGVKLIFKPSGKSCGGQSIEIFDFGDADDKSIEDLILRIGKDYVCQELVEQSPKTKIFNPGSLNTFRINSLSINGNTSVTNIMFRHGRGSSIVDNAGAGGVCLGLENDGTIIRHGIDANLSNYEKSDTGIIYKGHVIEPVKDIVEYAIQAHQQYLPTLCHVAWDFALNANDMPVMIEVNLGWPGIVTEQLSSGRPVYNTRVEEVIEFCKDNSRKLDWRDFTGRWI